MDIERTTGQTTKRFRTKRELAERVKRMENGASYEEAFTGEEIGDTWNRLLVEKPITNHDPVNHPSHYTAYKGLEIIDLTEQMNFNRGNAVKYIARAGLKNPNTEVEDLEKAKFYIQREIDRISPEEEFPEASIYRCAVCYLQVIPPSYLCSEHPDRATITPDGDTAWLHTRGTREE